ncbi:MAG: transcription antitermination factor NusB [Pseudomonadales bacterium]
MKSASAARSRARRFLVQALYQAAMTGASAADVIEPFLADHNMRRADPDYFRELMTGIGAEAETLDGIIKQHIDRGFGELDPVTRAILLLGSYELTRRLEVPYRVVINEAIELAKMFGPSESHRYVNSILDAVAKEHRSAEIQ